MNTKLGKISAALAVGNFALISSVSADETQVPLRQGYSHSDVPGGSIVKLCPESRLDDILVIDYVSNRPQTPYL